jgi:putative salt-induced outer membrane protein YdiY
MMKWLLALAVPVFALAQQPKARTWTNTATFSYVATSGNSSGQTLSFSDDYSKRWDHMILVLNGKMIRSAAVIERRVAIESPPDLVIKENNTMSVTAERYHMRARFDYRLKDKDRWYWYGGTSWEQNLPVGLDSRTDITAGVGRILSDSDVQKWRVDAGLGAKREIPSYPAKGFQKENGTFNLTSSFRRWMRENINYGADLAAIINIKKFEDRVFTLKQSLSVSMTRYTAIKIGFDMNHRNLPAMISIRAFTSADPPVHIGNIPVIAKKLDTEATTSLVVAF